MAREVGVHRMTPAGHLTVVPTPTLLFHAALLCDRKLTQLKVVPELSFRCTTTILRFGNARR